jgi:hypothetical protein
MHTRVFATPFAMLLLLSGVAGAVPLAPNTLAVPTPYVPAGATLVTSNTQTVTSSDSPANTTTEWTAQLTSSVYRLPSGMLEFWYLVSNISPGAPGRSGFVDDVSVNGYLGFLTDVYQADPNTAPDATNEHPAALAERGPGGNTLTFAFQTPDKLTPGMESYVLIVRTDTPNYMTSTAKLSDGTSVDKIPIYAPAAVPEPSTYGALLAAGMGVFMWVRQRKAS